MTCLEIFLSFFGGVCWKGHAVFHFEPQSIQRLVMVVRHEISCFVTFYFYWTSITVIDCKEQQLTTPPLKLICFKYSLGNRTYLCECMKTWCFRWTSMLHLAPRKQHHSIQNLQLSKKQQTTYVCLRWKWFNIFYLHWCHIFLTTGWQEESFLRTL